MADRVHVFLEGRVQGVGFRFATYKKASELGLGGWVRNLPDGRVEALFEGPKDALKTMLTWCQKGGPVFARVDNMETSWDTGGSRYRDFSVID